MNTLLSYLQHHDVDVYKDSHNYYVGGMETHCHIMPENVLVFFKHHPHLQKDTGPCFHHRYQLKINLGEESIFGVDELRFRMPTDSGMMIFPFQPHYIGGGDGSPTRHHLTISFTDKGEGIDSLMPLRNRPFIIHKEDQELLCQIVRAYQKLPQASPAEAVALLTVFLTRKLEEQSHHGTCRILPQNPFFAKLFAYIRNDMEHCSREKVLALKLGISESHLRKLVRDYYHGITLGKMLSTLRFGYARELLAYSRLTIADIAKKCGYADAFSFSRSFQRNFQMSPSTFRQQFRSSSNDNRF